MDIAFLNASVSRRAGGVFEVERRLAQKLEEIPGLNVQVFGIKDDLTNADMNLWLPLRPQVHDIVGPTGFGYAPTLVPALRNSGAALLHLQVLWMYPSVASIRSNIPYVTTTHGMLDSWAIKNSRLKKMLAATFYEKAALRKAKCLHAFTLQEYKDLRKFGLDNPIAIIPNGVDLPQNTDKIKMQKPVWADCVQPEQKVLLYLGRIHPKKGLVNLIKAWKQARISQKTKPDWVLAIAGWDQGNHEEELKQLVRELQLEEQVFFLGPQFNEQKALCFTHADAFVLPSFSEGLPMAVLEAWAYNLPVVITGQCNLEEGFQSGAAIRIDPEVKSICEGLAKLFYCSEKELTDMGSAGKRLVAEKFNWDSVAYQMHDIYKWVLGGGSAPSTVLLN